MTTRMHSLILACIFTCLSLSAQAQSTIFNVKTYGAQCDGSTDDTTAIANAISAASVAGGVVFTPASANGCVTGTQTISNATEQPNVTLQGTGNGSCWKSKTGQTYTLHLSTNVNIIDMCFVGNNSSGWAIYDDFTPATAYFTVIDRTLIYNYSQTGKGAIYSVGNITLSNSLLHDNEYAFYFSGSNHNGPRILNNEIVFNGVGTGSSGGGIFPVLIADGATTSEGGLLQGNLVLGNYNGIAIYTSTSGQVHTRLLNNETNSPPGYFDLWVLSTGGWNIRALEVIANYFSGNVKMSGVVTNFSWNDNHMEGGNTLSWDGSAGSISYFTASGNKFDGGSSGQQWTFNNVGPGIVANTSMRGGAGAMAFNGTDHLLVTGTIFSGTCSGGGGGQTLAVLATGGTGCTPYTGAFPSAW
jgi:hypothetical protein